MVFASPPYDKHLFNARQSSAAVAVANEIIARSCDSKFVDFHNSQRPPLDFSTGAGSVVVALCPNPNSFFYNNTCYPYFIYVGLASSMCIVFKAELSSERVKQNIFIFSINVIKVPQIRWRNNIVYLTRTAVWLSQQTLLYELT